MRKALKTANFILEQCFISGRITKLREAGQVRRVQACPTKLVPSREPLLSWRSFLYTELPLKDEKTRWPQKTSLVMIIFSLTGPDIQKKMYQMEIQLENMVAHFFGTFPFTQTDLDEN